MKQIIQSTLLLLALLLPASANAYSFEIDGIYYYKNGGQATVTYKSTAYNSYSGNIVIPETVTYNGTTYSVTAIGQNAFRDCVGLTSVTFGNRIGVIREDAFYDCKNLSKVNISSIEAWCRIQFNNELSNPLFYAEHLYLNDEELTELIIPYSNREINDYAFEYCKSLKRVAIPSSVTKIGNYSFSSCDGLSEITIRDNDVSLVKSIGINAFGWCKSLTNVNSIFNCVDSIGDGAFCATGFNEIIIPNSVVYIGNSAFYSCENLSSISIPASVNYIGDEVFSWCPLTNIHVDNDNTVYDSREGCNAIIETATNTLVAGSGNTIIPRSVTSIDSHAFYGCVNLTSIFIPQTVTFIGVNDYSFGSGLFGGCNVLTSVIVEDGNPIYDSRDNCNAIIETATNTLIAGCGNTIIPNTVKTIGNNAFAVCRSLTSINIPTSITSIGNWAFSECLGLTDISIGNSVLSIGESAFLFCPGLFNLDLGNSVTTIGEDAFAYCSGLTNVSIPNSVTVTEPYTARTWFRECTGLTSVTIGGGIAYMGMMFWNCPNITSVTCLATTPPVTDRYGKTTTNFDPVVYEQATLYVPAASLEAYQTAQYWQDFQDIQPIPAAAGDVDGDGVVGIADVTDLIDMLLNGSTTVETCPAADMDGDGIVGIADITELIDMLLSGNS